jgi:hypothetical protein
VTLEFAKQCLSYCNWVLAIGATISAIAGLGRVYFENQVKSLDVSTKSIISNSLTVSENGKATLSLDSPMIVDAIEVSVAFSFSAYLEAGMTISSKPSDWIVSGQNIFEVFTRAWNSGTIELSKPDGVFLFNIQDAKLRLVQPFGKQTETPISELKAVYHLKETYFLGYSSMLPTASETKDMISNRNKRTFDMNDIFKFRQLGFKEYSRFEDIPEQQAEIIRFKLVPKLDQSLLQNENFTVRRRDH